MKVFQSTSLTQGSPGDFCHAREGELLYPGMVCDRSRDDPDDDCGCGRCLTGVTTHKGTTTALVVEDPAMTRAAYIERLRTSLSAAGWPPEWARGLADGLLGQAAAFQAGDVVTYRAGRIALRRAANRRAANRRASS